jgi:hypothetical protein
MVVVIWHFGAGGNPKTGPIQPPATFNHPAVASSWVITEGRYYAAQIGQPRAQLTLSCRWAACRAEAAIHRAIHAWRDLPVCVVVFS